MDGLAALYTRWLASVLYDDGGDKESSSEKVDWKDVVRLLHASPIHSVAATADLQLAWKSSTTAVTHLELKDTPQLQDGHVETIVRNVSNLETLLLGNCPTLTNRSLDYITLYAWNLTHLQLGNCLRMNDDGFRFLLRRRIHLHPGFGSLNVVGIEFVARKSLRDFLHRNPNLVVVVVAARRVPDEAEFVGTYNMCASSTVARIATDVRSSSPPLPDREPVADDSAKVYDSADEDEMDSGGPQKEEDFDVELQRLLSEEDYDSNNLLFDFESDSD